MQLRLKCDWREVSEYYGRIIKFQLHNFQKVIPWFVWIDYITAQRANVTENYLRKKNLIIYLWECDLFLQEYRQEAPVAPTTFIIEAAAMASLPNAARISQDI